jgi:hypothetical protein
MRRNSRTRRVSNIGVEEYATEREILGFDLVPVIDNIINAANDYCCDGVDGLEDALIELIPGFKKQISKVSPSE